MLFILVSGTALCCRSWLNDIDLVLLPSISDGSFIACWASEYGFGILQESDVGVDAALPPILVSFSTN